MPTWTMDLAFFRPAELARGGVDDRGNSLDCGRGFYTSQGLMVRVERRAVEAATAVEALGLLVGGDYKTTFVMTPDVYLATFGSFDDIGVLCQGGDAADFG